MFFDEFKNDISCLYRGRFLVVVEHQSTINENMPLRALFYVTELLRQHVAPFKELVYRPAAIALPRPEFFVLYNGRQKELPRREMRLSDAFGGNSPLELIVKVYNLNRGMNDDFISGSPHLNNYCVFVNRVESSIKAGMDTEHAIAEAIDYCINHDVMAKYLMVRKKEVASMLGFEYDANEARRVLSDYYREEGRAEGETKGEAKGKIEGKIELVKNLLLAKTPIKYIAQATGWDEEKILKAVEWKRQD